MDFPPLPKRSDVHVMSEPQNLSSLSHVEQSHRVATPRVPPGFEKIGTKSSQTRNETLPADKQIAIKPHAAPVMPAIPHLPQLPLSPATRMHDNKAGQPAIEQGSTFKSNKLPEQPPPTIKDDGSSNVDLPKIPPESSTDTKPKSSLEEPDRSLPGEASIKDEKNSKVEKRPIKIAIPPTKTSIDSKPTDVSLQTPNTEAVPVQDSALVATPDVLNSRPVTPGTTVSEASKSITSRPRTLRLTTSMIQQAEAARITSPAMTEKSLNMPALSQARREHSRQPSMSSISRSRPSSPSASDRLLSQDVSRAGSPLPAGLVGSAPSRAKSKAQIKKERKEKAKKAEAEEAGAGSSVVSAPVEEVGPIIARQKKQKKGKLNANGDEEDAPATDVTSGVTEIAAEKSSNVKNNSPVIEIEPKSDPGEQYQQATSPSKSSEFQITETTTTPYTIGDLYKDALRDPHLPNSFQNLLSSNVSSTSKLLNEMIASGHLSRDHPWFTSPSFNSTAYKVPADNRRGQEYLDAHGYGNNSAFGYLYLDRKDKRDLRNGVFVQDFNPSDAADDLLNSFLLSPNGCVIRHLSKDESERVQELEYRRYLYEKELGDMGVMSGLGALESDDFSNLAGGLNELLHRGDRHGVHWVISESDIQPTQDYGDSTENLAYNSANGDVVDLDRAVSHADIDTDEEVGPGLPDPAAKVPGAWGSGFKSSAADTVRMNTPSNTIGYSTKNVNLRAMDTESLHKRIHEKHREIDIARKEMEKADKMLVRKGKEYARWRDSIMKG